MKDLFVLSGPESNLSFELKGEVTYVGRSAKNHIQIKDSTISRKHLKISSRRGKLFLTDLQSKNGTFLNGHFIQPGIEVEIKEGVPIVIGMSVICLGGGCMDLIQPLLDSIEIHREKPDESGIFLETRDTSNHKKLELLYNISEVLMENLPVTQTCEKILDKIFKFLKRIDRAAFFLVDPVTMETKKAIFRSNQSIKNSSSRYCEEVVARVVKDKRGVIISNSHDNEGDELAETLKILKIESVMCLPLLSSSRIIGAIYIDSVNRPYGFRKDDISLFNQMTQESAVAIEYAMMREEIEKGLEA